MDTVRINIANLKYQKTTTYAYVFLSETLRMGKGNEFNASMLSLPKSKTNIIRQRINVNNEVVPQIVEIPRWLFDKAVTGDKKLEAKITVI